MIDWRSRRVPTRTETEAVVLHHTLGNPGATVEAIDSLHLARGFRYGFGYHYLIRCDRKRGWLVAHGRPMDAVGAHAALGEKEVPAAGRTRGWWNYQGVGVAIAGGYDLAEPPPEAVDLALGLVVDLRSRYGPLRILSHREAMAELGHPGHTTCPGLGGWVDWIRDRLPADGPA